MLNGLLHKWLLGFVTARDAVWFIDGLPYGDLGCSVCELICALYGFWGFLLLGMLTDLLLIWLLGIFTALDAAGFIDDLASGDFYCSVCPLNKCVYKRKIALSKRISGLHMRCILFAEDLFFLICI